MLLRTYWLPALMLSAASVGCSNSGPNTPEAPPTLAPGSTFSALPMIAAASTDGQATELFVDPGTQYAMDASTAPSNNPNKNACEAAFAQLANDQRELRRTNEWEALRTAGPFLAVASGIKAVRRDNCHSSIATTGRCEADTQQLNTAIGYLWKSEEYQALQRTSEYAILQNDAHAIATIGPVWQRCADAHRAAALQASPLPSQHTVLAKYDSNRQPWAYQAQPVSARLVAPTPVNAMAHTHSKHVAEHSHSHKHHHHSRGLGSRI